MSDKTGRSYIDQNKVRLKREAEKEVPELIEFGEEADILAKAKIWNPKITPEELAEISRLYRDAKRDRARGK
jgi:hypothetical protein